MRLYYAPQSSAALRALLLVRIKNLESTSSIKLIKVGNARNKKEFETSGVWLLPEDDEETKRLGTRSYLAFNPEGRVPVLLVGTNQITQSSAIIDYLDSTLDLNLYPKNPIEHAFVQQIVNCISTDIHPLQNNPLVSTAMMLGMDKTGDDAKTHEFRKIAIRRGFESIELIFKRTAGKYSYKNDLTKADIFLVPQVRNALGCGIDVEKEFPIIYSVWENCLKIPAIHDALIECGGLLQPVGKVSKDQFAPPSKLEEAASAKL